MSTSLTQLFMIEPENDWRLGSACRHMDPELFFSPDAFETKQERDDREARAKSVCTACRVREQCLEYAVKAGERYGIWGGLTEFERRAYVRRHPGVLQRSG